MTFPGLVREFPTGVLKGVDSASSHVLGSERYRFKVMRMEACAPLD